MNRINQSYINAGSSQYSRDVVQSVNQSQIFIEDGIHVNNDFLEKIRGKYNLFEMRRFDGVIKVRYQKIELNEFSGGFCFKGASSEVSVKEENLENYLQFLITKRLKA